MSLTLFSVYRLEQCVVTPGQKRHWPLAVVFTLFYRVKTKPKNEGEEENLEIKDTRPI